MESKYISYKLDMMILWIICRDSCNKCSAMLHQVYCYNVDIISEEIVFNHIRNVLSLIRRYNL